MWSYPVASGSEVTEPVTLDAAKAHCSVDFPDDDALLQGLIATARDHVEKYCGINFAAQQMSATCESFGAMNTLPFSPVQEVLSIKYVDHSGDEKELPNDGYRLQSDPFGASLNLRQGFHWPEVQTGSSISLLAKVGFENTPDAVRHAVLIYVGDAYKTRENKPAGEYSCFDALLSNYRRFW